MSRSNILASALSNDKNWRNAEGFENAEGFGMYAQATGDPFGSYVNAEGNGISKTSRAYAFIIRNTNTSAVSNVSLFRSHKNISEVNNGLPSGVTITWLGSDFSYPQFLSQLLVNPFTVAQTKIDTTAAQLQLLYLQVKEYNGNGDSQGTIWDINSDPYQNSTTSVVSDAVLNIGPNTEVIIPTIEASTSITIRMFASKVFNAIKTLNNEAPKTGYSSPQVIKPQQMVAVSANKVLTL